MFCSANKFHRSFTTTSHKSHGLLQSLLNDIIKIVPSQGATPYQSTSESQRMKSKGGKDVWTGRLRESPGAGALKRDLTLKNSLTIFAYPRPPYSTSTGWSNLFSASEKNIFFEWVGWGEKNVFETLTVWLAVEVNGKRWFQGISKW